MSENTPLLTPHKNDDEEYEYYEEEWTPRQKYALIGGGSVLALVCIYFFAFFLPGLFIPEATTIEGIIRVSELDVSLAAISDKRANELGLMSTGSEEEEEVEQEVGTVERYIFVGDVHGHYKELQKLLKKVKYNRNRDHLLMLGDFIAKGPDSIKVLDFLIDNGVDCILGNHEYYALQNYAKFHGLSQPIFVDARDDLSQSFHPQGGFNDDPEYLLAKKFEPRHINYINNCSVIKSLGPVPLYKPRTWKGQGTKKTTGGVAVHAGLRWDRGYDLLEQDPIECLEMRSLIGPFYNESTDDPHAPQAKSWSKVWNEKQKLLQENETRVVYYGHDARRGYNLKKYAKGLDTGCDKGNQLSAIIIWKQKSGKGYLYNEQVFSTPC